MLFEVVRDCIWVLAVHFGDKVPENLLLTDYTVAETVELRLAIGNILRCIAGFSNQVLAIGKIAPDVSANKHGQLIYG
jgi:hypothetical protein